MCVDIKISTLCELKSLMILFFLDFETNLFNFFILTPKLENLSKKES